MVIRRIILAVIISIALAAAGASFLYKAEKDYLQTPVLNESAVLYELPTGTSLSSVLFKLEKEGILSSSWHRKYLTRFLRFIQPDLTKLKAGTYEIAPHLTLKEVLTLFSNGREHQFSLRLPEGKTFRQWLAILDAASPLIHQLKGKSEAEIASLLGCEKEKLEGLLLPETYHYTKGSSDLALLKRAFKKMQILLDSEWNNRDKTPYINTPYQALILASIIEKETAQSDERSKIAAVFLNRLQKGMRLQTDPTVIYGMGDNYRGNITRKDLATATAYNTYIISGLPPTPIAMPSKASVYAALHPEKNRYFYFVANGKGGHTFSRTLKEHNRAVQKFLKIIRKK